MAAAVGQDRLVDLWRDGNRLAEQLGQVLCECLGHIGLGQVGVVGRSSSSLGVRIPGSGAV